MTPDNFNTFSMCRLITSKVAYECVEYFTHDLKEYEFGFFVPKVDFQRQDLTPLQYNINMLTKEMILPRKSNHRKVCEETLYNGIGGLDLWKNNIVSMYFSSNKKVKVNHINTA